MDTISNTARAAAQSTIGSTTFSNQKVADLQNDISEPSKKQRLTTDYGINIADTDNWLKASDGVHAGPSLLEDQIAREKIHRFDHERIPERVVHARGTGAHGYFKLHRAIPEYSSAGVLIDTARTTPIFIRFSTVQGSKGSADTVRDVRGFAMKMYTQEGNWDIVGNNIPVFFIQDAIKFPDFVHAVKPEPHNEIPQGQSAHNNFWDFIYLQPESTHMSFWVMSDRGIPRSYRMMQGFGVNTFTLINAQGKKHFVKFVYTPELGVHSLMWDEALKISGQDPDFHRKDLEEAILSGAYPKWKFGIQVIPEENEHDFEFDILDATKVWPEELVPIQNIGEFCLDRVVDEFFPEVEQVAFCTSHVVPGVGFSDDPLLQGRNFSYFDTQISRLGINWEELPINRPVCPVMNFNRDGKMRHKITKGTVNYWPNRKEILPPATVEDGAYFDHPTKVNGAKRRCRGAKFNEHIKQAQLFYNSLSPHEKHHVINAFSFELDHCEDPIVYERMTQRLNEIDFDLAKEVAIKVGGIIPEKPVGSNHGNKSRGLAQTDFIPTSPTIISRKIAILIEDGFDNGVYTSLNTAIKAAQAIPITIGPRRSEIVAAGGQKVKPDHHFEGYRSTLVDAVVIPSGSEHVKKLVRCGRAVHYVREAFGHCKAIGAVGDAASFVRVAVPLHAVNLSVDTKVSSSTTEDHAIVSYGVVTSPTLTPSSALTDAVSFTFEIKEGDTGFLGAFLFEVSKHRCWEREMEGLVEHIAF